MHILLKDLLKEAVDEDGEENVLKIQVYCDMDGVLVDLNAGFMAISNNVSVEDYQSKNGSIFKLINEKNPNGTPKYPNFWETLPKKPDADVLWKYIKSNFKNPHPVILSAGNLVTKNSTAEDVSRLVSQKKDWIKKNIDSSVEVIVAANGLVKSNHVINGQGRITHVLIDDTKPNIDKWNSQEKHRIGILHTDAAGSIDQLTAFLPK
jgi:hypothetical protein